MEGESETERTKEEWKEGGRQAERRKGGSDPRTKQKSKGCNSSGFIYWYIHFQ